MLLLTILTGCATPALWGVKEHGPAGPPTLKLSPKAERILVSYYEKPEDLCSSFKSSKPDTQVLQNRAYWLFAPTKRGQRPEFVEETNSSKWASIPVVSLNTNEPIPDQATLGRLQRNSSPESPKTVYGTNVHGQQVYLTNTEPERAYCWKLSSSPLAYISTADVPPKHGYYAVSYKDNLRLWYEGKDLGIFVLPTYTTQGRATIWRVALTPIAFGTDVAILGVLVGVYVGLEVGLNVGFYWR